MQDVERIHLTAADGYALSTHHYHTNQPNAVILIAGATGVPQGFYRRFARYCTDSGFDALTLDYRGIGQSAPESLKGFEMDYTDWAIKDLKALLEYARKLDLPICWIGHSYGGHAAGMLTDMEDIKRACFFGTGAGWHGWMPQSEALKVKLLWHVIGPVTTHMFGYLKGKALGIGEDLPMGVYRQWKHWCRFPNYFFDDPDMQSMTQSFAKFRAPILAINALDDKWASAHSRDAFMQGYRQAKVTALDLDPTPYGGVGHMGYFRSAREPIWQQCLAWMSQCLQH